MCPLLRLRWGFVDAIPAEAGGCPVCPTSRAFKHAKAWATWDFAAGPALLHVWVRAPALGTRGGP